MEGDVFKDVQEDVGVVDANKYVAVGANLVVAANLAVVVAANVVVAVAANANVDVIKDAAIAAVILATATNPTALLAPVNKSAQTRSSTTSTSILPAPSTSGHPRDHLPRGLILTLNTKTSDLSSTDAETLEKKPKERKSRH
jgi:hypothetical protein